MILETDVFPIGRFTRTHGIHGEIEMLFTDDVFEHGKADYIFLKLDGLFVPFFFEEYRFKGNETVLFTLDGINSEITAKRLVGHTVYYPASHVPDENTSLSSLRALTGYQLLILDRNCEAPEPQPSQEQEGEHQLSTFDLGVISHVQTQTANTLLTVINEEGQETLIPLHDDFVIDCNLKKRQLVLDIPKGLLELND